MKKKIILNSTLAIGLLILTYSILISSCGFISFIKINNLMKEGAIKEYSFKKEISFKEINGKIIIPVQIENKFYDFLFDTGAITVVSEELSKNLKLKKIAKQTLSDFQGNQKRLTYTKIDTISIQGIEFTSIGCVISDFKVLNKEGCLNLSGIIGANIMNKCVWKIDYLDKIIMLTNDIDSLGLSVSDRTDNINFTTSAQGTPKLNLKMSTNINEVVELDTGSGDGVILSMKNIQFIDSALKLIKSYGLRTAAFGKTEDTTFLIKLPNFKIGNEFEVENKIVGFKNKLQTGVIGYQFLKNYLITIDWKRQNLYLSPNTPIKDTHLYTYGFKLMLDKEKLIVSYIYENTPAYTEGVRLYDQIIEINGKNYEKPSWEDFCNLQSSIFSDDSREISLKIRRGNQEIDCNLKKTDLVKTLLNKPN